MSPDDLFGEFREWLRSCHPSLAELWREFLGTVESEAPEVSFRTYVRIKSALPLRVRLLAAQIICERAELNCGAEL